MGLCRCLNRCIVAGSFEGFALVDHAYVQVQLARLGKGGGQGAQFGQYVVGADARPPAPRPGQPAMHGRAVEVVASFHHPQVDALGAR